MLNLFGKRMLDGFAENTLEYIVFTLGDTDGQSRVKKKAMDNFLAMLFLRNTDKERFGDMLVDFRKSYANKDNKYPQSVADMMDVMRQQPEKQRKPKPLKDKDKEKAKPKAKDQTAASYAQGGKPDKAKEDRKFYCCGKLNCVPRNFPDKKKG